MSFKEPTPDHRQRRLKANESIWRIIENIRAEHERQLHEKELEYDKMPLSNPTISFHVDEGRYTVELVDLKDSEPHPEFGEGMDWYFAVYGEDGERIDDDEGNPGLLRQRTSTSTGPKSKARPWIEALLGRPVQPTDSGREMQNAVLHQRAIALISDNERGYSALMKLSPIRKATKKTVAEDEDEQ